MRDFDMEEVAAEVQRKQIEGAIMALTIMAAEADANHHQRLALKQGLPRLIRQYRHTGETKPVLTLVSKVMFRAWKPSGEFAEQIDRLKRDE